MVEIKESIIWYLVKINRAIRAIEGFYAPVDSDELRFQYGFCLESIFSLIDYVDDNYLSFDNSKHQVIDNIEEEIGSDGEVIIRYMRELRNATIHRGFNLTSDGCVINGRFAIIAPDNVTNIKGMVVKKPSEKFLDKLIYVLDNASKNIITAELNKKIY